MYHFFSLSTQEVEKSVFFSLSICIGDGEKGDFFLLLLLFSGKVSVVLWPPHDCRHYSLEEKRVKRKRVCVLSLGRGGTPNLPPLHKFLIAPPTC